MCQSSTPKNIKILFKVLNNSKFIYFPPLTEIWYNFNRMCCWTWVWANWENNEGQESWHAMVHGVTKKSDITEWLNKNIIFLGYPGGSATKHPPVKQETWVRKIPWRRKWQITLVFLPGKFHGQRSLPGYSPWGHKRVGHNLANKE